MIKHLFIAHSILNHQHKIIFKLIYTGVIVVSLLYSFFAFAAPLKVFIVDTGFCLKESKNLKMPIDLTLSLKKANCASTNLNDKRNHGQLVLNELTKSDGIKNSIIFPYIVFDKFGVSKKAYWDKLLDEIKKNKPDVVMTAVGLINERIEINKKSLPIWVLATPRISPVIKKTDKIYPQVFHEEENVLLVGSINDRGEIDSGEFYHQDLDFKLKSDSGEFIGASLLVGKLMGKKLKECRKDSYRALLRCFYVARQN